MDIVSLLGQVAQNGVMSVLFVLSCFVNYRLFILYLQSQSMLLNEKDKHRENMEKLTSAQNLANTAFQRSIDILSAARSIKINE